MLSSTLIDEIGYLPIDQHGANMLFQVISSRYEHGSINPDQQQGIQGLGRNFQ